MTLAECTAMLTPVALALRAEFDLPTFKAYHRVLEKIPVSLAEDALQQLVNEGAEFMPTAPKILHAAERIRRQIVALLPWHPCAECEDFPGYRKVLAEGTRQETRAKCPCKARHRDNLQAQGILEPYATLPSETGAGDDRVYPSVDQLPARLREQVTAGASNLRLMK